MRRLFERFINPSKTDGDVLTTVNGKTAWAAAAAGSGGVQSVVPGTGIAVDDTDPANPVVSATGGGGGGTSTPTVLTSAVNSGNSNQAAITLPSSGFAAGDLLVIFGGTDYGVTAAPPGWALCAALSGAWQNGSLMVKTAGSGDLGAALSIPLSGAEPWSVTFVAVRGAVRIAGYGVSGLSHTAASTASAGQAASGDLVLAFGCWRNPSGTPDLSIAGTAIQSVTSSTSPILKTVSRWANWTQLGAVCTTSAAGADGVSAGVLAVTGG